MSFKERQTNLNDQGVQLSLNTLLEFESRDISSLRTLIIDNYDSYTFNLLQLWDSEKSIENVVVIRNNQQNPSYHREICAEQDIAPISAPK